MAQVAINIGRPAPPPVETIPDEAVDANVDYLSKHIPELKALGENLNFSKEQFVLNISSYGDAEQLVKKIASAAAADDQGLQGRMCHQLRSKLGLVISQNERQPAEDAKLDWLDGSSSKEDRLLIGVRREQGGQVLQRGFYLFNLTMERTKHCSLFGGYLRIELQLAITSRMWPVLELGQVVERLFKHLSNKGSAPPGVAQHVAQQAIAAAQAVVGGHAAPAAQPPVVLAGLPPVAVVQPQQAPLAALGQQAAVLNGAVH